MRQVAACNKARENRLKKGRKQKVMVCGENERFLVSGTDEQ